MSPLGHWFLFLCFRSGKIQNLMREGGKKKHLGKKTIQTFIGKVNKGNQIKKTLDEIKTFLTYFK